MDTPIPLEVAGLAFPVLQGNLLAEMKRTTELKRKAPLKADPNKYPLKVSNSLALKRVASRPKAMPMKTLKLRCDVLWRTYVKREGKCFFEGAEGCGPCNDVRFEAAHLIPRSRSARLKYDPRNGVKSCSRHHAMLDNKIAGTGMAWSHVLRTLPGLYEQLVEEAKDTAPMKAHEWEAVLERLKAL